MNCHWPMIMVCKCTKYPCNDWNNFFFVVFVTSFLYFYSNIKRDDRARALAYSKQQLKKKETWIAPNNNRSMVHTHNFVHIFLSSPNQFERFFSHSNRTHSHINITHTYPSYNRFDVMRFCFICFLFCFANTFYLFILFYRATL